MMSLDNALWIAGILLEAAVVGTLIYRRVWRILPLFSVYCAWDLLSNTGAYPLRQYFSAQYPTVYLVQVIVDAVFVLGVLVELAWSVLRPLRSSLSRRILVVIAILIVAVGAAILPFSGIHQFSTSDPAMQGIFRVQQTAAILRILFFLGLAGFSQLLSIGWRDRELQVATGLGFYSLASVTVSLLQSNQTMESQYRSLNVIVVASYLCSLLYWVVSFAQKEAKRREFTPQMQNFLLAVAGTARAQRVTLTDSKDTETQRRRRF